MALNGAGYWAELVDREFRHAFTTDDLRLTYGQTLGLAAVPLGAFYFGEEATAARMAGGSGPNTIEIQRTQFTAIGGWALTDVRIHAADGRLAGTALLYKPAAAMATLGAVAAMGDLKHFARMLSVAQPARRPAAILFADLEASSSLARRLSTAGYFAVGRRFVTAADRCIVDGGGLVGRHVGDGVGAFFLAETAGSESAAARACITAARDLRRAMAGVAARSELEHHDAVLRFGLHWGSTAYVGWITTTGRSEVTALGDEVNEAARIEACASGGRMLASRSLIQRLDPNDAGGARHQRRPLDVHARRRPVDGDREGPPRRPSHRGLWNVGTGRRSRD